LPQRGPPPRRSVLAPRCGAWNLVDIDGLGELLSPALLERLQGVRGSAVIYTHLGKRRAGRARESRHIPDKTRCALERLAEAYAEGRILLSATSKFLDYLVLRDHACVGPADIDSDTLRVEHKVLLLTNPSANARYVARKVHETLGLAGIVVQDPRLGVQRMRGDATRTLFVDRLYSYLSVKDLASGERLRSRVQLIGERLILEAKREFLCDTAFTPGPWPKYFPVHSTPNINRKETLAWCRERSPDLLLVCGTSILREPLIGLPRLGALNAHTNLESAGVTVHFIDVGVDSGDLVLQRRVEASLPICPGRLCNRNVMLTGKLPSRRRGSGRRRCPEGPTARLRPDLPRARYHAGETGGAVAHSRLPAPGRSTFHDSFGEDRPEELRALVSRRPGSRGLRRADVALERPRLATAV